MTTRMTTAITTMTTPIDPRLITLAHWLSPAFPTGGFAYSHGLEQAVAQGWVRDAASLSDWLCDLMTDGTGQADAGFLWLAWRADDSAGIDAAARAFTPARERLRESTRQGAAFARLLREIWQLPVPDMLLPVTLGHGARLAGIDAGPASALYLHGFAANLVACAQRLMPLGQTEGQRLLAGMAPLIARVAAGSAAVQSPDDIHSNAFMSDVAAMRHETQEPRIFQS